MWSFIAEHIFGLLATVLGLGTGGVGFAVFGLGIPFFSILQRGTGFFGAVIEFFSTPLGQVVGVVLLCLLCFVVGDMRRARIDARAWDAKVAASEAAAIARDNEIKSKVAQDANARIAEIAKEKAQLESKVADYAKKLDTNAACRVTSSDLKRLRK